MEGTDCGRRAAKWITILALLLLLPTACGSPADKLPPASNVAPAEYRLGPGDRLRIIVFGEERLTGEFQVGVNGDIALPLVGSIHAAGHTAPELEKITAQALKKEKLFSSPSVTAEVVGYRPIFILGEVNKPGQYPYQPGMSVVTAVAVAGGFTYRAVDTVFSIVRSSDSRTVEERAGRQSPVLPGDVITVFERRF